MTSDEQERLWVEGDSRCPNDSGECCPDFSCCKPELLAPKEEREAFTQAQRSVQESMLMTFLGRAIAAHKPEAKVHIAGDPSNYEEPN